MNKQSVMLQENSNQEKVMYIVYFDYNSDCFINAPDTLIEHVTHLFIYIKWFRRTGKIPWFLITCSLVPIVQDNLSDISASDNYKAIAIDSLMLK